MHHNYHDEDTITDIIWWHWLPYDPSIMSLLDGISVFKNVFIFVAFSRSSPANPLSYPQGALKQLSCRLVGSQAVLHLWQ